MYVVATYLYELDTLCCLDEEVWNNVLILLNDTLLTLFVIFYNVVQKALIYDVFLE